ncbi:MAG: ABC transporter permease subunit [Hyphomicrobiaceae bacterium]|nr:ABC transporter permease subunit [Hyphomicrobiaceae bacterium]
MTLTMRRIAVLVFAVGALEVGCRAGWIDRLTIVAPSDMALRLGELLATGNATDDILFTLKNILAAIICSIVIGFIIGTLIHGLPRLRTIIDPLLTSYYAVPIFVFYPLLIVIFGITSVPLIIIGTMFGVVAMIVNTLTGLDRVPRALEKTGRLLRLGRMQQLFLISLPAAGPYFITGMKFSIIYATIAVIAGEFILSARGIGYRVAFAYNSFDGRTMYALLLLLLTTVTIMALTLHGWEKKLHRRWGRE